MSRLPITGVAMIFAGAVSLSAQQPATSAAKAAAKAAVSRGTAPSVLPGTQGTAFSTIRGNALSSSNGQLAGSTVRLRDARLGRIVETKVTNPSGVFEFTSVDPGNYVIELVGNDEAVVTASQVLTVNAGDVISAIVRMPFRVPPFAGLLGNSAPQAAAVISAAAASGVLAENVVTTPASVTDMSPY